jgi:hypothetical protein
MPTRVPAVDVSGRYRHWCFAGRAGSAVESALGTLGVHELRMPSPQFPEFRIEQLLRPRMVGILGTGVAPALPDLVARLLQRGLVGRVLPQHQILDDPKQPLPLALLCLLGRNRSGCAEGSSTICAMITARATAEGRRTH